VIGDDFVGDRRAAEQGDVPADPRARADVRHALRVDAHRAADDFKHRVGDVGVCAGDDGRRDRDLAVGVTAEALDDRGACAVAGGDERVRD
jgi:hypothetical protein